MPVSTEQNLMAPGADGFLNIAANALRACVNAARGPRRCGAPGSCAAMHVDRTCGPDLWAGLAGRICGGQRKLARFVRRHTASLGRAPDPA